ncbi:MAG TPA: CPBP family intramembrane glutamic endopeptidase [Flavobacterium sp.]|nr:CPBP family intramembrane glutamic endopeptidase [Flavobacterium sp.]
MFIEQGVKPENRFWKYLVGSVLIIVASAFGQLPWVFAAFAKLITEGRSIYGLDQNVIMTALEPNLNLFLMLFSFVVAIFAIFLVIRKLHGQTVLSVTTSRPKIDWGRVFFSFGLWAMFTVVSTVFIYFESPESFVVNFKPVPFLILVVIGTLLIPVQTSTEEYVFRGYLMQGFANLSGNKWFPLLMTSVIFGSLHFVNPEVTKMGNIIMVYYIGTGLFLGILTLMDEGMELALGFHAANNLIGALLLTSDWTVFQTHSILKDVSEPTVGFDVLFPILVIFPILLFIFSKKYGWTDWAERLTGTIDRSQNHENNPIHIKTENNDNESDLS